MAYVELRPVRKDLRYTDAYDKDPEKTAKPVDGGHEDGIETVMDYVRNKDKTEQELYVTGINCSTEHSVEEFLAVQRQFGKDGKGIIAHHGWQSFSEGEDVDADLVHQIGIELAKQAFGDRFQVIVTTHLNKKHLHNHFLVNAVSFVDGKKYYGNKESLRRLRQLSDDLCRAYGLSVIDNPQLYASKSKGRYRAELHGHSSWRSMIRADIDAAVMEAADFNGFAKAMREKGYVLKNGKHFAASPPGYTKQGNRAFIRLRSLEDEDYTLEGIKNRLAANKMRNYGFAPKQAPVRIVRKKVRSRRKLPHYMAVYYRYMYRLGLLRRKPRQINRYAARKGQRSAAMLSQRVRYIKEHKIYDSQDLSSRMAVLQVQLNYLLKKRRQLYNRRSQGQPIDEAELARLSSDIRALRSELRICEGIGIKPTLDLDTNKKKKMEEPSAGKERKSMRKEEKRR